MPKKALEPLTESMYYVLLCLHEKSMSGSEISEIRLLIEYEKKFIDNRDIAEHLMSEVL